MPASILSDQPIEDRQVLHRDGLFGPKTERLVFEDGTIAYTTTYPWYYFAEQRDFLSSMNIYGIEGSSSSNEIYLTAEVGDDPIPIVVKQQNDLDFTNSEQGTWWDFFGQKTQEPCDKSQLVMYDGIYGYGDNSPNIYSDPFHDRIVKEGFWQYGETWTSTLHFYPVVNPMRLNMNPSQVIEGAGSYSYTIEETLYPEDYPSGFDTDKAWVHVSVQEGQEYAESQGTGSITVKVLDNLYQSSANVDIYKDGQKIDSDTVDGATTFDDLEFGDYRFEVTNTDYDQYFVEAVPYYDLDKSDQGIAELTAEHNSITYVIYGDYPQTEGSGFDTGDDTIPGTNGTMPDLSVGDGGDGNLDKIIALMESLGFFVIVALGLPLFMVMIVGLLLFMYHPATQTIWSKLEARIK
jgi:hypothetical protein